MIYSDSILQHAELLAESFFTLTGNRLITENVKGIELAGTIYNAPFVVVSHGVEADPVFNFANMKAQELWETSWEEFVKMPSRLSAEQTTQSDRQSLLKTAQRQGYISGYNGIRISKSGKRFHILNTTLWNLTDAAGNYKGQAAMFKEWKFL